MVKGKERKGREGPLILGGRLACRDVACVGLLLSESVDGCAPSFDSARLFRDSERPDMKLTWKRKKGG